MTRELAFEWDRRRSLGDQKLDQSHNEMIAFMRTMLQHQEIALHSPLMTSSISELVKFATGYFREEERHLQKIGYPDLAAHEAKHLYLLREICDLCEQQMMGNPESVDHFFRLCHEIYETHLLFEDKRVSSFLRERNGIDKARSG